ncbi:MAG: chitobiase/beta-hexosaminidase C-terminal domain-containing protein [Streptococcus sp.]
MAKDLKLSASKNTGTYNDSFEVTLTAGEGQSIYYTVDGSQPTISSTKYSNSLTIDESMTLKAIVVDNQNISEVYEFDYSIDHQDNQFIHL